MPRHHPRRFTGLRTRRAQAGMSLLEIIIVIVLIGGVLALVGSRVIGGADKGKYKLAQAQIQTLAGKLESYKLDTNQLPKRLDDLVTAPQGVAGWLGPYAKPAEFKDPWGNAIDYRVPGQNGAAFALLSLGADGQPGGESYNADIQSE